MSRLTNSNNNDIISSCEAYMARLMKKKNEKPRTGEQRNVRERSACRQGPKLVLANTLQPPNKPMMSTALVKSSDIPPPQQLVHKEIFDNNMATVEVTVRTVSRKRSRSNCSLKENDTEPWGKILQKNSDENMGSFRGFDPLRTLHFLSKELQLKLQTVCPGDPSLQQIINDMQHALRRLPPDVISKLSHENIRDQCGDNEFNLLQKKSSEKMLQTSTSTQTVIIGDSETKKMQKQLEDSAYKLEASCKQMEDACSALRQERDNFETKYRTEQETNKSLQKKIEELTNTQNAAATEEIERLKADANNLRLQMKELQNQIDDNTSPAAQDLKTLIQELRSEQLSAEQENTTLKNQVTMMKFEKDKMNVILETRDKQLKGLRSELDSIQSLVCSQLMQFKTKSQFSPASSMSSVTETWKVPLSKCTSRMDKSIHELYMHNPLSKRSMRKVHSSGLSQGSSASTIIEKKTTVNIAAKLNNDMPQTTSRLAHITKEVATRSDMTLNTNISELEEDANPENIIKEMFNNMKRQALDINVRLPDAPSEISPTISNCSRSS